MLPAKHMSFHPNYTDIMPLGKQKVLDGIRGMAVIAVMGHNMNISWIKGGFFGVDVFFALSGFLITTLLMEERLRYGSISLPRFYGRRALRLYPVLVVLVCILVPTAILLHMPVTKDRLILVAVSVLGYFSNWLVILDSHAWMGALGHTWSLAVEMHFYIIWSLVLFAATRWQRKINFLILARLALIIFAITALWRIWIWKTHSDFIRAYNGSDTRFDALMIGSAASLLRLHHLSLPEVGRRVKSGQYTVQIVEIACVFLLGWLMYHTTTDSPLPYLGGFSLTSTATSVLILTMLLCPRSLMVRFFRTGGLVWIGRISYSLYLWHLPVIRILTPERLSQYGLAPWPAHFLCIVFILVLATCSYYCIERFFLQFKCRLIRLPAEI